MNNKEILSNLKSKKEVIDILHEQMTKDGLEYLGKEHLEFISKNIQMAIHAYEEDVNA